MSRPQTAQSGQLNKIMNDHQFEIEYWGNCANTFDEDQKHYVYARFMGLERKHYSFDVHNKRILDIGGGPTSMLLKTINLQYGKVIDPIEYPLWTKMRYKDHNIDVEVLPGEYCKETGFDEVWIYNCMQHAEDVQKIIDNCKRAAPVLRIFEWVDIPPHDGHPIMLTKDLLDNIIGQKGSIERLQQNGCYGTAYFGVFKF